MDQPQVSDRKQNLLATVRKIISIIIVTFGLVTTFIVIMQYIRPAYLAGYTTTNYLAAYFIFLFIPVDIFIVAHLIWPISISKKLKIFYATLYFVLFLLFFIIPFISIDSKYLEAFEINRFQYTWNILTGGNYFYLILWLIPLVGFFRFLFIKPKLIEETL